MWLVPATLADAPLLFAWAEDERRWLEAALPEAARWRSDKRRLKRSLHKQKWGVRIASEPDPSPERGRRIVGLLATNYLSEVRWAVCPDYDSRAVATKMLKMLAGPGIGLSVTVNRDDVEAQSILTAAGFTLLVEGIRQLWGDAGVAAKAGAKS